MSEQIIPDWLHQHRPDVAKFFESRTGQAGQKPAMPQPTPSDPFGERPDPTSFAEMMEKVIDARIAQAWRSRAITKFQGIPDGDLVAELLARGWAVFKPKVNDQP